MEVLLGTPPPPPPPNVPGSRSDGGGRRRPSAHGARAPGAAPRESRVRVVPSDDRSDRPRRSRTSTSPARGGSRDNGAPVDPASALYDGTPLAGPADLRQALLKRSGVLVQNFTENLMTLRVGRRLAYDRHAGGARRRARGGGVGRHGCRRSCSAIVKSPAFRMKADAAASTEVARSNSNRGLFRWRSPQGCFVAQPSRQPGRRWRSFRASTSRGGRCCAGSARRSRCRFSTRWCRRAALWSRTASAASLDRTRLVCIEMVHGAAGSSDWGASQHLWSPAATGAAFDLTPSALESARAVPQVSDDRQRHRRATAPKRVTQPEIGGDHFRSSAVFLTQTHPKQTESSDVRAGISLDQIYAKQFGQDTPIPSMQLCIENVDQAGGCAYGYSCVYTDMISWASPTEPLPMIRDPRMAFDQLFGAGGSTERARRARRRRQQRARLHHGAGRGSAIAASTPAIAQRMDRYLEDVREIERRIQQIEARNVERRRPRAARRAGRRARLVRRARQADVRSAGARVPGRRHARVLVQDGPRRVEPRLSGKRRREGLPSVVAPRQQAEQHRRVRTDQPLPRQPAAVLPREAADAAGRRRRRCSTAASIIYGSPMGDGNVHNHKRCPLVVLGGAQRSAAGQRASCEPRRARRWRT